MTPVLRIDKMTHLSGKMLLCHCTTTIITSIIWISESQYVCQRYSDPSISNGNSVAEPVSVMVR